MVHRLDALNLDLHFAITRYLYLQELIFLSQTSRVFRTLSIEAKEYWKYARHSISPAFFDRIACWSELTASEIRDAAIKTLRSNMVWNFAPKMAPFREVELEIRPGAHRLIVPGSQFLIETSRDFMKRGVIDITVYNLKTGGLAGSFHLPLERPVHVLMASAICKDARPTSTNTIVAVWRVLLFKLEETSRREEEQSLLVFKISIDSPSPELSSTKVALNVKLLHSIPCIVANPVSISEDGVFICFVDMDFLYICDIRFGYLRGWSLPLKERPEEVCIHGGYLIAAYSGVPRFGIINASLALCDISNRCTIGYAPQPRRHDGQPWPLLPLTRVSTRRQLGSRPDSPLLEEAQHINRISRMCLFSPAIDRIIDRGSQSHPGHVKVLWREPGDNWCSAVLSIVESHGLYDQYTIVLYGINEEIDRKRPTAPSNGIIPRYFPRQACLYQLPSDPHEACMLHVPVRDPLNVFRKVTLSRGDVAEMEALDDQSQVLLVPRLYSATNESSKKTEKYVAIWFA